MSSYKSPKGGFFWSDADWIECIKDLIPNLSGEYDRAFYTNMLDSITITSPSGLSDLYIKVLKAVLKEQPPLPSSYMESNFEPKN